MKQINNKGFTLVELIVVITILAILGTIAFIALQGYSASARDSKRLSDINNIKKSLELFSLNTSKYPLPDNGYEALFSGSTIWTQGIVGDNVTTNLSKNLQSKPLDPLSESEYTYSVTFFKNEYELFSFYESDLVTYNNLLNGTLAVDNIYPKIDGTYNQVFVKTDEYIVPTPSIVNSELVGTSITLDDTNIQSQVTTGGDNLLAVGTTGSSTGELDINLSVYEGTISSDSGTGEVIDLANSLQNAYSGSVLAQEDIYEPILSATTENDKIALINQIVLHEILPISTSVALLKNVTDCINQGEIIYGTLDGTDTDMTCDNDIIVCSGSGTGYTLAACNVGQTDINGYIDCVDAGSCNTANAGKYFQYGRNKGFDIKDTNVFSNHIDGTIGLNATSDTYSFIGGSTEPYLFSWANTDIRDNWGDVTNEKEARQGPCPSGYYVPDKFEWNGIVSAGGWSESDGTAMSNDLKLPFSGSRNWWNLSIQNQGGIQSQYWTSSTWSGTSALYKLINKNMAVTSTSYNSMEMTNGASIRCFKIVEN